MSEKDVAGAASESARTWRFNITAKMFCAFLAVGVLVSVVMGAAQGFYFRKGFLDYLSEQEEARIVALADSLAEEYGRNGNWTFLQGEDGTWRRQIGRHLRGQHHAPSGDQLGGEPNPADAARRSYEIAHLRQRLGLSSPDKHTLLAGTAPGADAVWTPVVLNGREIAWLTRAPLDIVSENTDVRFQEQQRNTGLTVLAATLCLAALASILLARVFVAPLRRIGRATNALTHGDYSARADVQTKDEIQTLAGQVNSLAATLQKNEDARRIFMAEIAHELRTPLAVLTGELEAIQDGIRKLTPEAVASLRAEVAVLVRLVDDIHTLSLMDLGTLAYEKKPTDLAALLGGVAGAFRERMAGRGLALHVDLPAGEGGLLEIPVSADHARLSQVLNNLLENSLRYTHVPGTVRATARIEGNEAVAEISDSAPGVAQDELERIFERFHTTDPSRSRKNGGSGLGLSISRGIIQAHGGRVEAAASPLGGLLVRIWLPLLINDSRG